MKTYTIVQLILLILRLFPPHQPPHSPSDIFVPEGVDERIETGCDNSVEEGNELGLVLRIFCSRLKINAHSRNEKERHNHEMGSTCPKGLLNSCSRLHPQDSLSNGPIGSENEDEGDENKNRACDQQSHLISTSVNTGYLEQCRNFTDKVIHLVLSTQGDPDGEKGMKC